MKQKKRTEDSVDEFEPRLRKAKNKRYALRLYVTGMTARSKLAIQTIKSICDDHLKGRYDLEVIDIYRQPVLAKGDQIIATPTLIKKLPLPLRKFIGDLTDKQKILLGLDLRPKKYPFSSPFGKGERADGEESR